MMWKESELVLMLIAAPPTLLLLLLLLCAKRTLANAEKAVLPVPATIPSIRVQYLVLGAPMTRRRRANIWSHKPSVWPEFRRW